MKKQWFLLVSLLILLVIPLQLYGQTPSPTDSRVSATESNRALPTNQIIIKYQDSADLTGNRAPNHPDRMSELSAAAGVELTYFRAMSGDAHVLRLPTQLPMSEVKLIVSNLMTVEGVEYAEPDTIMQLDDRTLNAQRVYAAEPVRVPGLTPNDPQFSAQWHYQYTAGTAEGLNLPSAWNISTGSPSTVVAVLDTGILNHADLAGRTVAGYDMISDAFVGNDGDARDADPSDPGDWTASDDCYAGSPPSDSSWHGTHVAGTIGAATNNAAGVAGVNWQAKIQAVRVLGKCGGYTSDIADGIRWASGNSVAGVPNNATPAKVLNLSLGGSGSCSITSQDAIDAAVAAGSVVIVAAGNSNDNVANYNPANCNNVVTVAATNPEGDRSYYSNFGALVEVAAPGGEMNVLQTNGVLSTLNTGTTVPVADAYVYYQGTSMATPHVAGLASLIVGMRPSYNHTSVLSLLQSTARSFPGGSTCNPSICGVGIVDAFAALNALNFVPTEFIYLPIAMNDVSTTPPTSGVLNNGNFESGPTVWTEFSTHGWDLILSNTDLSAVSVTAHSGSWAVWLGGDYEDISYIQQVITVPSGTPDLSFWYWIGSQDVCGFDYGYVIINGAIIDTINLCSSANTGGWAQRSVSLNAYAGQTVTLTIQVNTDSSLNSNLFVDDVAFVP